MNNLKNEKGITLISLVITIVVLTIITTITISVSNVNNGLVGETINATKQSQINKYIELIEITRQEAMSREYVLEMNGKTVLQGMLDIMNDPYADKIYKTVKEENGVNFTITGTGENGVNFTITGTGENAYIEFITVEGYKFHITETSTSLQS